MKLQVSLCVVVSRHSLHLHAVGETALVAVGHYRAISQHIGTPLVGDDLCAVGREQLDGLLIEMVGMLVRDKEIVGLGIYGIVDLSFTKLSYRVDFYLRAVETYP